MCTCVGLCALESDCVRLCCFALGAVVCACINLHSLVFVCVRIMVINNMNIRLSADECGLCAFFRF